MIVKNNSICVRNPNCCTQRRSIVCFACFKRSMFSARCPPRSFRLGRAVAIAETSCDSFVAVAAHFVMGHIQQAARALSHEHLLFGSALRHCHRFLFRPVFGVCLLVWVGPTLVCSPSAGASMDPQLCIPLQSLALSNCSHQS